LDKKNENKKGDNLCTALKFELCIHTLSSMFSCPFLKYWT
jgi:hypothetical protein